MGDFALRLADGWKEFEDVEETLTPEDLRSLWSLAGQGRIQDMGALLDNAGYELDPREISDFRIILVPEGQRHRIWAKRRPSPKDWRPGRAKR